MRKKMPIFYSALMLTGVNLLLRFVSTSFQVYITGRIGAAGVGLLQLVLSVGTMAMVAGTAGIRTATMYLTAEELGRKRSQNVTRILSSCLLYSIVCSGAVALLLSYFAPAIAASWLGAPNAAGAIGLLAGFLPVSCLCGVMTGYFTAAGRIGTLSAVGVAEQLTAMLTTVLALTLWAGSDPERACQSVVLGSGIGSILTLCVLVFLRLREKSASGPRIPTARRLLGLAVPLALADDLKTGISTTENLMVPKRLALFPGTDDPLALFGIVSGMVFPVLMFPACILFSLAELLIPELARCNAAGSTVRIRYLAKRSLRVGMLYGFLFGGLMYLVAPDLCQALYGNSDAGRYLRQFSLLIPMLYCDAITDAINKGLGKQSVAVRYNVLTAALDVAFLFLLLPKYGMAGYYLSFLVTHALNFLLSLGLLLRTSRVTLSWKVPVFTGVVTVLSVFFSLRLPSPALSVPVFLFLFVCLAMLLGILKKEDAQWLRGLFRNPENSVKTD